MKVLLIYRGEEFSPNNVRKDALLIEAVGQEVCARGDEVRFVTEQTLEPDALKWADAVFSQARRFRSLMCIERSGVRALNTPMGVRRALSRETTLRLLEAGGIPVPPYWCYDPESDEMWMCEPQLAQLLPGWIKGMHPGGVRPGDVQYVEHPLQVDSRVIEMQAEGYDDIVVTRHMPGFVVKCYCVGGRLIHWMLPQTVGYTKFGDESHNDAPDANLVDEASLQRLAREIGEIMCLEVFGFDAIVSASDAGIYVIDVNDAPSFSPCRQLAAEQISRLL